MMQRARTFAVVLTVSLAFTHYCLRSLTFVLKKILLVFPTTFAGTLWTKLSEDAGKMLLKPTGILDIASPDNEDLIAIADTYVNYATQ